MSYYGGTCRGPYVINGITTKAFTTGQSQVMLACREQVSLRKALQDHCADKGGDSDHDGWCDEEDACPFSANTFRSDADNDGVPDACDLCPNDPVPSPVDTDGDGAGDVCDPDDDNDTCLDNADQNPKQANPVVGTIIYPNCTPSSGPVTAYEGNDPDGDGIKSCKDSDDDNDGVPDQKDQCPVTTGSVCLESGETCPREPIWDVCQGSGSCVEFLLKLVAAVNPDPTRELVFDRFTFVGQTLWAKAARGKTLSETAKEFEGASLAGGLASPSAPPGNVSALAPKGFNPTLRLEVIDRTTNTVRGSLVYDPAQVRVGTITHGTALRVQLPKDRAATMTVDATWAVGAAPDERLPDTDRDGVPDVVDICLRHPNPSQADYDGDGFGDRCDPDFDQNGRVDRQDLSAVRTCLGAELTRNFEDPTDGLDGPPGPPPPNPDLVLQQRCGGKDLDGNGHVDHADLRLAREFRERPPGPSGVRVLASTSPRAMQ